MPTDIHSYDLDFSYLSHVNLNFLFIVYELFLLINYTFYSN